MSHVHVIHENQEWTEPLYQQLEALGVPYQDWFLNEGTLDLSEAPPEGVFYNRMSASSHTRDHRYSAEFTGAILAWLEGHGRQVVNGSGALRVEISKVAQYAALEDHGIRTPRTIATLGKAAAVQAARKFDGPFITKHNRGGKGLGVSLFRSVEALERHLESAEYEAPIDGILLLQEYIESPDATITRCEFVGREFLYAVRVDTSDGFELCPADACQVGDAFCPTTEAARPRFEILSGFHHPILDRVPALLEEHDIHVAALELITDRQGEAYAYDLNTNTNYNSQAEAKTALSGMGALAEYLGSELESQTGRPYATKLAQIA